MLNSNSKILITGGTGSFGKAFLFELMNKFPNIERVVIYSRDELKQWELQNLYPKHKFPRPYLKQQVKGDNYERHTLILNLNNLEYS